MTVHGKFKASGTKTRFFYFIFVSSFCFPFYFFFGFIFGFVLILAFSFFYFFFSFPSFLVFLFISVSFYFLYFILFFLLHRRRNWGSGEETQKAHWPPFAEKREGKMVWDYFRLTYHNIATVLKVTMIIEIWMIFFPLPYLSFYLYVYFFLPYV